MCNLWQQSQVAFFLRRAGSCPGGGPFWRRSKGSPIPILGVPLSNSIVFCNATLVTLGEDCQVIPQAACWVDQGVIRAFGPQDQLEGHLPPVARIDLGGRVLMPGQINAHDHLYSAFARGIALKDAPPENFLQILERLWWRLDAALNPEDVYLSGLLGFSEAVQRGTTCLVDHHASPNCIAGSLERLGTASLEVGLRACLCYETTDRHGAAGAALGIEENLRFFRHCQALGQKMLTPALGLHASITVGPETLKKALNSWPEEVPIHVHVAEDACDVEDSLRKYQRPPLQRLMEEGLKDRPTWAAHCIHLQPHELELLGCGNITVMHNPRSNLNNAVGCAPVKTMLEAGVAVALGTDGMSQDPSEDARTLAVIHKHQAGHPQAFGFDDIYRVALLEPARLASRRFGIPMGVIAKGAAGDFAVYDYDPPTSLHSGNFLGHWLFGLSTSPCWGTWVDGRCVYLKGQVAGIDLAELKERCRRASEALWQRW